MRIGFPLQVISKSASLYTCTLSWMKIDTFPSLEVFPTLIKDARNSSNMSASADIADSWGKGSRVTYFPFLVPPLATATRLCDGPRLVTSV